MLPTGSPSDPCVPFGDILSDGPNEDGWGMYDGLSKRATVQAFHASELGVDFAQVTCVVRYIRVLSRQESWDRGGRSYYRDLIQMRYGIGYYFRRQFRTRVQPEGFYFDALVHDDGGNEPVPAGMVRFILEDPAEPPYGWTPHASAPWDELVEYVGYSHPLAHRVYICEA